VNLGLWEQGNETVGCIQTRNLIKTEQVSACYKNLFPLTKYLVGTASS